MNEISVVVTQEPGKVSWNFEEIKKTLENELEVYRATAYTDATIKTAKGDVATLRKLPVAIKERLKEIKEKCLEPYAVIEAQAKELIDLVEEPIKAINDQIQDYEKRRKEAARKEILSYWNEKVVALPEDIREKAYTSIYDERWENARATKKSWKEGIDNGIKKILDEIETIKSFKSEFEEDVLAVYKVDLSLQKAIAKMNELKAQQERILEIERKKQEAEQRRKEEEERQKQQAALKQQNESQGITPLSGVSPARAAGMATSDQQETSKVVQPENAGNIGIPTGNIPRREEPAKVVQPEPQTKAYPGGKVVRLLITGTPEQITKIQNYIRFAGATYQEV